MARRREDEKMNRYTPSPNQSREPRRGFVHISDAIACFRSELFAEVEEHVERTGGFCGPVRPRQRPWSRMLDILEQERAA